MRRSDALPAADQLLAKAGAENFPVASRLLPRRVRAHLLALYGFARLVDDVGDESGEDATPLLDAAERELDLVFTGTPAHPVFRRLQLTVRACDLQAEPFRRLIEANRRDQVVTRYATFAELLSYCELSANPVGHLVLAVFDDATPERLRLSDRVCTALQLVEHVQDVKEDYGRGRVYLPREDLDTFGVRQDELAADSVTPAMKELVAFEVERCRRLLDDGAPLVGTLRGWARWAVAGFVAGGSAAMRAIERADHDVWRATPKPKKSAVARALVSTVRRAR